MKNFEEVQQKPKNKAMQRSQGVSFPSKIIVLPLLPKTSICILANIQKSQKQGFPSNGCFIFVIKSKKEIKPLFEKKNKLTGRHAAWTENQVLKYYQKKTDFEN